MLADHPCLLRTFGFKLISTYHTPNKCINSKLFSKYLVQLFLRPLRSKDVLYDKRFQRSDIFDLYIPFCRGRIKRQINQNFGTVCHTEVCLTFSRLTAKLSEMITKFRGRSLKIKHQPSFDLNGLINGTCKYFENNLKSMHLFQKLMGTMNCR